MYIVREVFQTKPGKAKDLVAKFKKAMPAMQKMGFKSRVMTDAVATYWTVIVESETEDLGEFFKAAQQRNPEMQQAMEGYMDLVTGGHREIWKVE